MINVSNFMPNIPMSSTQKQHRKKQNKPNFSSYFFGIAVTACYNYFSCSFSHFNFQLIFHIICNLFSCQFLDSLLDHVKLCEIFLLGIFRCSWIFHFCCIVHTIEVRVSFYSKIRTAITCISTIYKHLALNFI